MNPSDFPPPPSPPPLLSAPQILSLAQHGHLPLPLPPHLRELYAELSSSASTFFSLNPSSKNALYAPVNTELGYVDIPNEKSYLSFRASVHRETELEQLIAAVWEETYNLLYRILADLAWALNVSHEVWEKVLDGEPTTGIAESHTDLGLLTLCVGDGQGLQCRVNNQGKEEWVEYAEPTLLAGKTLATLSGGRLRAGIHRVVGNEEGRSSIVYALRPSTKHEVDLSVFPGGGGIVHMGELWKRMWVGAFNVNAPREVREKQKERRRATKDGLGDADKDGEYDMTNTLAAITG